MRKSLQGVVAEWWTLPGDEDEPDPVQFYLRPLNGLDWTSVMMTSYDPGSGEVGGSGVIRAFQLGVKNWRGIEDANNPGKALAFSRGNMRSIHATWIMLVGRRVLDISELGVSDSKNSD